MRKAAIHYKTKYKEQPHRTHPPPPPGRLHFHDGDSIQVAHQ